MQRKSLYITCMPHARGSRKWWQTSLLGFVNSTSSIGCVGAESNALIDFNAAWGAYKPMYFRHKLFWCWRWYIRWVPLLSTSSAPPNKWNCFLRFCWNYHTLLQYRVGFAWNMCSTVSPINLTLAHTVPLQVKPTLWHVLMHVVAVNDDKRPY